MYQALFFLSTHAQEPRNEASTIFFHFVTRLSNLSLKKIMREKGVEGKGRRGIARGGEGEGIYLHKQYVTDFVTIMSHGCL